MLGIVYCIGFVITFSLLLTISVKYLPEYGWRNFFYSTVTAFIFPIFWLGYFISCIPKKKA